MIAAEKLTPADRLLEQIKVPDDEHENWPDFRLTLAAIHQLVNQILADRESKREQWLEAALDALLESLNQRDLPEVRGKLATNLIGDCPVFAALADQPKAGHEVVTRSLQAHYLVCIASREEFRDQEESVQYIQSAGLGVRKFALNGFQDCPSISAIATAKTPEALYKLFDQLLADADEDEENPQLRKYFLALKNLRPLLYYVTFNLFAPSKDMQVKSRRIVESHPLFDADDDELDVIGKTLPHSRIISRQPTYSQRKEYAAEASAPFVETQQDVLMQTPVLDQTKAGVPKSLTESQVSARAKRQADAMKSSLQPTPSKRATLHIPAIRVLTNLTFDPHEVGERVLADVLIAIMLLTGCRPEEIYNFRIWRSNKAGAPDDLFAIILDTEEFRVPVRPVPEAWQPTDSEKGLYRQVGQHFHLSIPNFLPVGRLLLAFADAKINRRDEYTWPENSKSLQRMLRKRLKALNERFHLYLFPQRISSFLAGAVYALEGDTADAYLLTSARSDPNDSRLYYYAPSVAHLRKTYDEVWRRASSQLVGKTSKCPVSKVDRADPDGPHIGSAAVPLTYPIREANAKIDDVIDTVKRGRRDLKWRKNYHNRVTAALFRQVFWMTGIRPVRDVIEYPEYDSETGYLAVGDKDNEDLSTIRLVWLIPAVQDQLQRYDQQLQWLAERLEIRDPSTLGFRFIVKKKSIQKFNWKNFRRHLGIEYRLRPNAHRHYIRTRLRELGVDGSFVDALMGHAGVGREPFGHFSALVPEEMRRALEKPLHSIWRELGFRAVI